VELTSENEERDTFHALAKALGVPVTALLE
jgi:hypothetical protein